MMGSAVREPPAFLIRGSYFTTSASSLILAARSSMQRCRIRGGGDDHDAIVHGARILQLLHHRCHSRALLPDRHVDADDAGALLIDDRVHRDGRLAGASITND